MSRRSKITLTEAEQAELLEGEPIVVISTIGPRGWPHSMPLWFMPRDGDVWVHTYGKSQKIVNLERDPRATLLVEAGEEYQELRGVMIEAEAEIHRDFETVLQLGKDVAVRMGNADPALLEGEYAAALEAQARKRVAIHFVPKRVSSWDHRKLGGDY
ncbi:MAG: pyridoxamine 5'-phosphate oxidase family protein [Solirubrobacterales bacterium]